MLNLSDPQYFCKKSQHYVALLRVVIKFWGSESSSTSRMLVKKLFLGRSVIALLTLALRELCDKHRSIHVAKNFEAPVWRT